MDAKFWLAGFHGFGVMEKHKLADLYDWIVGLIGHSIICPSISAEPACNLKAGLCPFSLNFDIYLMACIPTFVCLPVQFLLVLFKSTLEFSSLPTHFQAFFMEIYCVILNKHSSNATLEKIFF